MIGGQNEGGRVISVKGFLEGLLRDTTEHEIDTSIRPSWSWTPINQNVATFSLSNHSDIICWLEIT
jgi:hypothetical protein